MQLHLCCLQSHRSMFSRHSSRSLNADESASQQQAAASKRVHHLAWAFDWGDPPRAYIMIYELTQWFGKARVYLDGAEVLVKRYSFLQQVSGRAFPMTISTLLFLQNSFTQCML